jgi:phosphotransferase system  glucose/maltose/N-acetylglucosamine-specific IIC component
LPGNKQEEEAPTSTKRQQNINKFSGAIAEEKEDFCKGSLSLPIFYFVIVLLYFIFACMFLSKIQKKLVPLIACIRYFYF